MSGKGVQMGKLGRGITNHIRIELCLWFEVLSVMLVMMVWQLFLRFV